MINSPQILYPEIIPFGKILINPRVNYTSVYTIYCCEILHVAESLGLITVEEYEAYIACGKLLYVSLYKS